MAGKDAFEVCRYGLETADERGGVAWRSNLCIYPNANTNQPAFRIFFKTKFDLPQNGNRCAHLSCLNAGRPWVIQPVMEHATGTWKKNKRK